ncbi:MAG: serine protease [Candidatus Shapirobacteria bacterium]|nr:serine protease [Candidatus Shapirobacteria bacterium]
MLCIFFVFYWSNTITPTTFLASSSVNINTNPNTVTLENLSNLDFTGVNKFRNAVIKVNVINQKNTNLYGTGFFISDNKIITTAHCLQIKDGVYVGSFTIQFSYQQADSSIIYSKEYKCQVDLIDPEKDIATGIVNDNWVLSISQPLNLSQKKVDKNQTVTCYGYPADNDFVSTTGTFSSLENISIQDKFQNNRSIKNALKFKMIIKPGNSGGPVITDTNYLVGIICSSNPLKNTSHAINTLDAYFVIY